MLWTSGWREEKEEEVISRREIEIWKLYLQFREEKSDSPFLNFERKKKNEIWKQFL